MRSTEAGPDLFASTDEPGFVDSLRKTITAANVLPFASLDSHRDFYLQAPLSIPITEQVTMHQRTF